MIANNSQARELPVTAWIKKNRKQFRIKKLASKAIQEWLPGWHNIYVEIEYQSEKYVGIGQAQDKRLAIEKAYVEALERWVFNYHYKLFKLDENSNGWAAHPSKKLAFYNSRKEAIERDLFLCHFYSHTPFQDISGHPSILKNQFVQSLKSRLESVGLEIKFGLLPSEFSLQCIIATIFGDQFERPFGLILGMGIERNRAKAIEKASLEALVKAIPVIYGFGSKPLTEREFRSLKRPQIEDHKRLGLNLKTAQKFRELFQDTPIKLNKVLLRKSLKKLALGEKFELAPEPELLSTCPVFISRYRNSRLQSLNFGKARTQSFNTERIVEFCKNRGLSPARIQKSRIHLIS